MMFVTAFLIVLSVASAQICDVSIVGAGAGGVYTAWRIVSSTNFPANRICIFEREQRAGGRIYPVNGTQVPELGKLVVELGAYRWDPLENPLTHNLITNAFQKAAECYTRNNDCHEHVVKYQLRGQLLDPEDITSSANLPYFLRPSETFNAALNKTRQDTFEAVFAVLGPVLGMLSQQLGFPGGPDEIIGTLIGAPAFVKWPLAQTVMNAVKNFEFNGIPLNKLNLRQLIAAGMPFSEEYLALDEALFGTSPTKDMLLNMNLYEFVRNMIYHEIASKGFGGLPGGGYRVMTGNKAYWTVFQEMLDDFQARGGNVLFGYNLVQIDKHPSGTRPYRLGFANGETLTSQFVVLNTEAQTVKHLLQTSAILAQASEATKQALAQPLYNPVDVIKVYFYYNDAWWLDAGLTSGTIFSTDPEIGTLRYHDGRFECNNDGCRGVLLTSFTFRESSDAFGGFGLTRALNVFRPNDPLYHVLKGGALPAVQRLHPDLVVPAPDSIIVAKWPSIGGAPGPSNCPAGEASARTLRPLPDENIFIANVDYGQSPGFAEGSLRSAEKIVRRFFPAANFNVPEGVHQFTVEKPSWLEVNWYNANIMVDN